MSRLNETKESLSSQWKILLDQWSSTCANWNDPVRHRFERDIWNEFDSLLPQFLGELEKLDDIVRQAQREVR